MCTLYSQVLNMSTDYVNGIGTTFLCWNSCVIMSFMLHLYGFKIHLQFFSSNIFFLHKTAYSLMAIVCGLLCTMTWDWSTIPTLQDHMDQIITGRLQLQWVFFHAAGDWWPNSLFSTGYYKQWEMSAHISLFMYKAGQWRQHVLLSQGYWAIYGWPSWIIAQQKL